MTIIPYIEYRQPEVAVLNRLGATHPMPLGMELEAVPGSRSITVSYNELLRSAITVGRHRRDLGVHGVWSRYEAVWRAYMIRANLVPLPARGLRTRLVRFEPTSAFKALDPSEKAATTFFLGLTCTNLMARKLLDVRATLHVDVYTRADPRRHVIIDAELEPRGERPDLLGMRSDGSWAVLEAKGRTERGDSKLRLDAKRRTQMIGEVAIQGEAPAFPNRRYACIASLGSGYLAIDWVDPADPLPEAVSISIDPVFFWVKSLELVFELVHHFKRPPAGADRGGYVHAHVEDADFSVFLERRRYDVLRAMYERTDGRLFSPTSADMWSAVRADAIKLGVPAEDDILVETGTLLWPTEPMSSSSGGDQS
jgi:hypothetical protein